MRIEAYKQIKPPFTARSHDTLTYTVNSSVEHERVEAVLSVPPEKVDILAIVTLGPEECAKLNLKSGYASVFGERA